MRWPLQARRQIPAVSFDHLIGNRQQGRRQVQAECFGGLQVDDELEFSRLHNRKVGWLFALEDSAGILTNLTVRPRDVGAITSQPTSLDKFAPRVSYGQRMTCRECDDFNAPVREERVRSDEERVGLLPDSRGKRRLQIARGAGLDENHLSPEPACSGLYVSFHCVCTKTRSIDEQRNF